MDATLKSRIETLVNASPVLLFMKGNKLMQCKYLMPLACHSTLLMY